MRFIFNHIRKDFKPGCLILGRFSGDISVFHLFYTTTDQLNQAGEQPLSIYRGALSADQTWALSVTGPLCMGSLWQ